MVHTQELRPLSMYKARLASYGQKSSITTVAAVSFSVIWCHARRTVQGLECRTTKVLCFGLLALASCFKPLGDAFLLLGFHFTSLSLFASRLSPLASRLSPLASRLSPLTSDLFLNFFYLFLQFYSILTPFLHPYTPFFDTPFLTHPSLHTLFYTSLFTTPFLPPF